MQCIKVNLNVFSISVISVFVICLFPLFCLKSQEIESLTQKEKHEFQGYYLHPLTYHHPERYKNNLIQLKDSSIWSILSEDREIINNWKKSHELFIQPVHSSFWPDFFIQYNYALYNLNEDAVVSVFLKQIENNALFIEIIDIASKTIYLNDKTMWKIDEKADISNWKMGQRILIGVHNQWRTFPYPQILINADLYYHPYISAVFLYETNREVQ